MKPCLIAAAILLLFSGEALAQQVVGDYVYTCPAGLPWNDPRCIREPVDRGEPSQAGGHDAATAPVGPVARNTAHWALAMGVGPNGKSAYALGADPLSAKAAESVVFRRCASASVRNCRVVHQYHSGVLAIAQAPDGGFFHGVYPYPQLTSEMKQAKKARKAAGEAVLAACAKQMGGRCKLLQVTPSHEWLGYDE
jgi:hypothetical protein